MKALVTLDAWKFEIFDKALRDAGFPFDNKGEPMPGIIFLEVETEDAQRLRQILEQAARRAAQLGPRNS